MPNEKSSQPIEQHSQAQTLKVPSPENQPSGPNAAQVCEKQNENRIANLEDKMRSAERIMAWLTGAIALFALGSVIVGFLQWNVMNGQLTLTRKQLVATQAAALKVSRSFDIEGFIFALVNIRDMDATNVRIKTTMTPISILNGAVLASPVVHERALQRIEKENPFGERLAIPWPLQGAMQEGWPGTRTVKVDTEYAYEDGFGTTISGSFCDVWLPILNITTKRENATLGGSIPCQGMEDIIRDILARKEQADQEKNTSPN